MKSKILYLFLIFILLHSCTTRQKEIKLPIPDDFIALLDYHTVENANDFGTVVVISKTVKGKVKIIYKNIKEEMEIKPGEIKRFTSKIKLEKGEKIKIKAKDTEKELIIKYDKYQSLPLGGVETKAAMFTDNTYFYATKTKQNFITMYHISKNKEGSFGFPDKDTVWFAIAFKNRIKISDTEGILTLKKFSGKNHEIYYVTIYYYDTEYNFVGGFPGWEARYIQEKQK